MYWRPLHKRSTSPLWSSAPEWKTLVYGKHNMSTSRHTYNVKRFLSST